MVTYIIAIALCTLCTAGVTTIALLTIRQLEKERGEWQTERSKLLDRIQSGGLSEFKAQERAEKPIKRIEKPPAIKGLEKERWL